MVKKQVMILVLTTYPHKSLKDADFRYYLFTAEENDQEE